MEIIGHKKNCKIIPFFIVSLFLLFSVSLSFAEELSQPRYNVIEELDVKIAMRDGVRLSANIFRPDAPGKFPALLMRTPYNNGGSDSPNGNFFAPYGYAIVIQNTRGRFESEGVFDPLQMEALDGYDTLQWISIQPWCNEKSE